MVPLWPVPGRGQGRGARALRGAGRPRGSCQGSRQPPAPGPAARPWRAQGLGGGVPPGAVRAGRSQSRAHRGWPGPPSGMALWGVAVAPAVTGSSRPPHSSRGALTCSRVASCRPASLSCVFTPRNALSGAPTAVPVHGGPGAALAPRGARLCGAGHATPRPLEKVSVQLPDAASRPSVQRRIVTREAPREGACGDAQGTSGQRWEEGMWCHGAQSSARKDAACPSAPDGKHAVT